MAKSKRKAGKVTGILLGVLFVVIGMASAAFWVAQNTEPVKPMDSKPKHSANTVDAIPVRPHKYQTVKIYVIKTHGEESELVPQKLQVPARADRYEAAVSELLQRSGSPESTIPEGTILRSVEVTNDGTAVVDLSKEFIDNFGGGSEEESLAINAIVKTLAQFENIKKVQVLVEGNKAGTLGGHFELEEPIDVQVASSGSEDISE